MASALPPEAIAYQQERIDENKGPVVITVSVLLMSITIVAVGLRFVARFVQKLRLEWDDWLSAVGLLMIVCMCVSNIYAVRFGLGKHLIATNPATGYRILEIGFFLSMTYTLAHFFIKMSILLFYIRIFDLRMKWFKVAVYATMAYVSGWAFSLIVFILAQCRPISYFWTRFDISRNPPARGVCTVNVRGSEISTSVLNTIADFAVLILPIIVLAGLQLNKRKKIALISVFLVGSFACVAGIVRLHSTTTTIGDGTDITYKAADTYLWTMIEASVGLMCACFPIIGPMFKTLYLRLRPKNRSYLSVKNSRENSMLMHSQRSETTGTAKNTTDNDSHWVI